MSRIKFSIYEIVSVATGLALITFFGTLMFLPFEIMMWGEGQTIFWVYIIIGMSTLIIFLILSLFRRELHGLIMRIINVVTIFSAIFLIISYLSFTKDLFEPWLTQTGWFLRYNGPIVGIFAGCVLAKTIVGVSQLISKFNESHLTNAHTTPKGFGGGAKHITLFTVIISFAYYSFAMIFLKYFSLFATFLTIFLVEAGLAVYSILTLLKTEYYNDFWGDHAKDITKPALDHSNPTKQLGQPPNTQEHTKIPIKEISKSEKKGGFITKIGMRVKKAGSDPSIFWYLFIPLLIICILSIVTAIVYPLNIVYYISFQFGTSIIFYPLPLTQLLSFLSILLLLFIIVFNTVGGRMNRRLGKYYSGKIKRFFAVSTFGLIDIMRILGIFLVFSQILYFYDYPIFLPEVVTYYLLFGILGAGIYYLVGWLGNWTKLLYAVAILLLVLNFYLTYTDGIANASNPYGGEFDIMFPFEYLHSPLNYIIVGIPVGIIMSDLLFNMAFTHTNGIDAPNRAVFVVVTPFIGGLLFMLLNYIVGTPGGDPPPGGLDFLFYYFCVILGGFLLVGLVFNYLVTELLIPFFIEKKSKGISGKPKQNPLSNTANSKVQKRTISSGHPRRKAVGVALAGMMILSFIGGFSIYSVYSQTYQRPIICSSPGNYYIWIQNSSERVSKHVIVDEGSPHIEAVKLALAKNEYGAIQLVWYPFTPVQTLSYTISDFVHQNGSYIIEAGNCSLRQVEFVIEEEFPDILVPFATTNLNLKENNVFWFAIRTPYDATEGTYIGNLTFSFTGGEAKIPFQIQVWNFTIPHMKHLRTNIGGRSTDPERIDTYVAHRINDYGVDIKRASSLSQLNSNPTYTCYLDTSSNTWTFNWTWWDAQIQAKLDRGMNAFTLPYPLGIPRNPPIEDATWMLRLKNWLNDVEAHLTSKGWLNYSYFYFIDEYQMFIPEGLTQTEYFARLKILLSEMKNASPQIKIMTTAPPFPELEEYIDIFCPISNDRDKAKWDELLAQNYEFWFYSCVGPMAPWPNAHLYNRLYEIRIELWQVWLYKIHGFLFWSSTAYYHGHYGLGYNGYGDGWFIYEREGTLYDSIRWENFLEGQEDYEYLWLLNATLQYLTEHTGIVSPEELANYKLLLENIVNSVVGERWVYCDHVATLYQGRDQIGTLLNSLGGLINLTSISEVPWFPPLRS
ncbi:MAG: glycoside hydrolase domain-containing protein [Candidatus Helarchaeota archaeon]